MWAPREQPYDRRMDNENQSEVCSKCGSEVGVNQRVDLTLKAGTRVCEQCFIRGNAKVAREIDSFYRH